MGGSNDESAPGASSSSGRRLPRWVLGAAMLLCFGLVGLILWAWPAARRRRRDRGAACRVCRSQQRVGTVVVAGFAVLLLVGAGVRTSVAATPLDECSGRFTIGAEEALTEGPSQDPAYMKWWATTRGVVTAPTSGAMLAATSAVGMSHCSGSAVIVAFPPPPAAGTGGSVVGGIFVSWISEADGAWAALPGAESYVQFDTDTHAEAEAVEAIARHESRHVDQWAVATMIGGPVALPVAYYFDSLFFPFSRNHFERAAGLEDGGYDVPSDTGPRPLWLPLVVTAGLLLLLLRRRIRWASRVAVGGGPAARAHDDGRCPLHSRGWLRAGPASLRPVRTDDG